MSQISKEGISAGSQIKAEHVLRIINALTATDANDISILGTLSATYLEGDGSNVTNITPGNISGSVPQAVTASLATAIEYTTVDPSGSTTVEGSIKLVKVDTEVYLYVYVDGEWKRTSSPFITVI